MKFTARTVSAGLVAATGVALLAAGPRLSWMSA